MGRVIRFGGCYASFLSAVSFDRSPMETAAATIESQLCDAVARFHREQQGFAPKNLEAAVVGDMVIVRSEGIFTPNEESLLGSEEGKKLITSARRELRSLTRREVEAEISKIVGC